MKPNHSLTITRQLKHERARVFSALTDPAKMSQWFFMTGGRAQVTNELRRGGKYRIEMSKGDYKGTSEGEYLEIVPPERLVFSWHACGGGGPETRATITLAEQDGGTLLTIVHELPEEQVAGHRDGWNMCFDHLGMYLDGRRPVGAEPAEPAVAATASV